MGYLEKKHGVKMIGKTPAGTCPECAVEHDPEQPHNKDSLTYQYKFYDAHGRWPTWADAMAHCPEKVKKYWMQELKRRGIEVSNSKGGNTDYCISIFLRGGNRKKVKEVSYDKE